MEKLGIGIITHNRLPLLTETVSQVRRFTTHPHGPYELLIADDGSEDGTADWARSQGIPVVTGDRMGAAWNINRALYCLFMRENCQQVILLADDCQPTDGGWDHLWSVSAKTYGACFFAYDMALKDQPRPSLTPAWGGGVMAFDRWAFELTGYADVRFSAGWGFEDADLGRRYGKNGNCPEGMVWGLNWKVRHLEAPSHRNSEGLKRNAAIFDQGCAWEYCRPYRTEEERIRFQSEVLPR